MSSSSGLFHKFYKIIPCCAPQSVDKIACSEIEKAQYINQLEAEIILFEQREKEGLPFLIPTSSKKLISFKKKWAYEIEHLDLGDRGQKLQEQLKQQIENYEIRQDIESKENRLKTAKKVGKWSKYVLGAGLVVLGNSLRR